MNRTASLWNRGTKNVSYARFKWAVFVALFFVLISCKQSLMKPPGELVFEPQKFTFPEVEHVSLGNGMVVYLLEDHELPLFNLVALARTGSIYEPDDKLGLAELTGVVMRTGGTRFMSGDEINEKLEFVAGSVETSIGEEVGTASLSVLKNENTTPGSAKNNSRILNFLNKTIVNWLLIPDSKILWLPFALFASLKLIYKHKIKIILTTSPPHSAHLGGLVLKWVTGINWVADFRDDWAGGESQPNPTFFHSFFNKLFEKFALKFADRIIGMCDHLTNNLRRKGGSYFKSDKFITITNGYDAEDFSELLNLEPHSKFTITHSGSISKVSDPESFLKAIFSLFEQNARFQDQIQIQFFGTDILGYLESKIKKYGLEKNILPIKYLSHFEILREVMRSHLLLLTINKKTNEEIITGKVFEYLGSGKPILLISGEGEVARLIRKFKRGSVVNNKNIEEIKKTILNYYNLYQQGFLKFSKPLSIKQFNRKTLTGHLAKTFSELMKK